MKQDQNKYSSNASLRTHTLTKFCMVDFPRRRSARWI